MWIVYSVSKYRGSIQRSRSAPKVRGAETVLEAQRKSLTVPDPPGWSEDKEVVMEEIVTEKVDQVDEVKAKLDPLFSAKEPLICVDVLD
jgi:hypothetical protein